MIFDIDFQNGSASTFKDALLPKLELKIMYITNLMHSNMTDVHLRTNLNQGNQNLMMTIFWY